MRLYVARTIALFAIAAAGAGAGTGGVQSLTTPPAPAPAVSTPTAPPIHFQEDDPEWNCATMGNRICGPRNAEKLPAGCYDGGTLVIPWAKMTGPQKRHTKTSPCAGMAPTQEQESDAAYAAAQRGK